MNDCLSRRKGHSKPNRCKDTAGGSACLMLGVEAAVRWTGLEKPRVSMTDPTTTLQGPAEWSCVAGLYRTSLGWVFQLRGGFGEAEEALGGGEETHTHSANTASPLSTGAEGCTVNREEALALGSPWLAGRSVEAEAHFLGQSRCSGCED